MPSEKELEKIVAWCDNRAKNIPNMDWYVIQTTSGVELCTETQFKRLKDPKIIYRRLKKSNF